MIFNQRKEVFYLALISILGITINVALSNMVLSIITSIGMLLLALIGIRRYSSLRINNIVTREKGLAVTSTLVLILSLGWIIMNMFTVLMLQFVSQITL